MTLLHDNSEVQQAATGVSTLFTRWKELLQSANTATDEEFRWTTNELKTGVRSIEWDLQDLDETIIIVEANPKKFDLSPDELASRKKFIAGTRAKMSEIKQALNSSDAQVKQDADQRNVCCLY